MDVPHDFFIGSKYLRKYCPTITGNLAKNDNDGWYLPMTGGVDEVKTTVNSVVHNIPSVKPTLIVQVFVKLVVNIFNHIFVAENKEELFLPKETESYCL